MASDDPKNQGESQTDAENAAPAMVYTEGVRGSNPLSPTDAAKTYDDAASITTVSDSTSDSKPTPFFTLPKPLLVNGDATRLPFADGSFDLVFTSPPYVDARTYGRSDVSRACVDWVAWMLDVVGELTRVCRGLVLVNCAGVTRDRVYQPAPEGLCWEWFKRGGNLWRPAYWNKVGIPGSGGKQWLRADVEYVLAFKRDAEWLPWSNNVANGHPPKWAPGGEMSHRLSDGSRRNQWGKHINSRTSGRKADGSRESAFRPSHFVPKPMYRRNPDGSRQNDRYTFEEKLAMGAKLHTKRDEGEQPNEEAMRQQPYQPPAIANPGNVIKIKVGGGMLGHPFAHENEAPFPVDLAAWFIRSWCPPGGKVLDPFSGSGSTCHAAWLEGRVGVGLDLRMSQCDLARRRLLNPFAKRTFRKAGAA